LRKSLQDFLKELAANVSNILTRHPLHIC